MVAIFSQAAGRRREAVAMFSSRRVCAKCAVVLLAVFAINAKPSSLVAVGFVLPVPPRSGHGLIDHALPSSSSTRPLEALSRGQPRRRRWQQQNVHASAKTSALMATVAGTGSGAQGKERGFDAVQERSHGSGAFAKELGVLDQDQAAMMAEQCILVDRDDRPTGSATKVETHLTSKGLLLHRAFSVFLFDRRGRMLMQKRADSKHTFAGYWTNTCCSHPLWNDVEMGTDLTAQRGDKMASEGDAAIAGAKRAAIRKLEQELGIPPEQLPVEGFSFLTKVHYIAESGSTWGEHEIDYVFLIQADVDLDPNPNEVSEAKFLDQEGLRSLLAGAERGEVEFTPWSAYIIDKFVFGWWDHVGDQEKLATFRDDVIHRVGSCGD